MDMIRNAARNPPATISAIHRGRHLIPPIEIPQQKISRAFIQSVDTGGRAQVAQREYRALVRKKQRRQTKGAKEVRTYENYFCGSRAAGRNFNFECHVGASVFDVGSAWKKGVLDTAAKWCQTGTFRAGKNTACLDGIPTG